MKIGVALSGCDTGGVSACGVLRELGGHGFDIAMISASCVPAVPALLYARGFDGQPAGEAAARFLKDARESDMGTALSALSGVLDSRPTVDAVPLAINSVDISNGDIVTFTNDFTFSTGRLITAGMEDPRDALGATVGLMDGLENYNYNGRRLCDFCCWYGCPIYPLKMAGIQKIISVAFVPKHPRTPYEVLVRQMIAKTASLADVHISIEFAGRDMQPGEYLEFAANKIKSCEKRIFFKTLF